MKSNFRPKVDIGVGKKNDWFKDSIYQYIELRLAALGVPLLTGGETSHDKFMGIVKDLLSNYREREILALSNYCPSDKRIQDFFNRYFASVTDVKDVVLPKRTFTLDSYGVARGLSLPKEQDKFISEYVSTYRVKQGILNNPKNDRRTTKGVFHIAEGGLPIPDDKKAVPLKTAKYIFQKAFSEQGDIMNIPYASLFDHNIRLYVSLLLRPIVCPEVTGIMKEKSMEIRFFAPGSLVSNLDFVESIFGNAGSPYHINNDPALDIEHFSGQTGCIVLAPQLTKLTKKECLLPPYEKATPRQRRDGMCYKDEKELYNDGSSFKLTIRDDSGFIATVIADNYFGYSKKEVKTMISYASNLFGGTEEEHAGGAMIFPGYNQGDNYFADPNKIKNTLEDVKACGRDFINFFDEGYGIDRNYPNIYYLPENTSFSVPHQDISWKNVSGEHHLKLLPNNIYILPNGSKFRMEKYSGASNYRLIETVGDGLFCHKPCTVSGGGKSEISKSISDAIFSGSFFVSNFDEDFKKVEEIIDHNYSTRFKSTTDPIPYSRRFLSNRRSMGSVIKLLTPSNEFTDEYNHWLDSFPQYIKGIAFMIKRFYKEEWGDDWKSHFSVDILNGTQGNELKFENKKIYARYLRVGFAENGTWRTFKLRQDFVHADKVQMEDDVSASIVVPSKEISNLGKAEENYSVKFVENCEYRLFQRPDDAINRGYDKKAEQDLSSPNTFISNYEPLTVEDAKNMVEDVINFDKFTKPMRDMIKEEAEKGDSPYFVSSAHPRLIDGKPSKNVRYLQTRNDIIIPEERYVANVGVVMARKIRREDPLYLPINSVLPGRRNNPKSEGIRPLAVYNPIHYQELPELFMDFICSLSGKSPSTTGAGSEGALTKGPFNALCTITDLNNALLSFILTGYDGFTTPAGYIGKKYRIDHDLSLLIPELWARLSNEERNPKFLIKNDYFEKVDDFHYKDKLVRASILGYRVTEKFVHHYFGRVFENPNVVFTSEMLKPEEQSMEDFVEGIENITENYTRVAMMYFNDGSVEAAIEPLKALLNIMTKGSYNGMTIESEEFRNMFTRDYVLASNWYKNRLKNKQNQDILLWERHKQYLIDFLKVAVSLQQDRRLKYENRIAYSDKTLDYLRSDDYYNTLIGTIGKDNLYK